jgi:thymidylate kinase
VITVSLIGVDGVGKTTVARRVESDFPVPIKYLYMGSNINASNYTLPTTRWWRSRRRPAAPKPPSMSPPRKGGVLRSVRKTLGFLNRIAEELYRAGVVARYRRKGYIVLLDRHFVLDYFHEDHGAQSQRRPLKRRMQGFLRQRVHPMPELVIYLDISGRAAHARKGEFTPEFLDERRRQYLELRSVIPEFAIVDAHQDLDVVVRKVRELILRFYEQRCNGRETH